MQKVSFLHRSSLRERNQVIVIGELLGASLQLWEYCDGCLANLIA